MSTTPTIEARGLTFSHGENEVVRDVSLAIQRGETVGIIGPNGAGKTTLLSLLTGCLAPQRGEVLLGGVPLHAQRPEDVARRISVVPQAAPIAFGHLVADMVAMGRHPHRSTFGWGLSEEDRRCVIEAMEQTDTFRLARRRFNQLSGGEQQRVLVARALAQTTDIMLLDEPTAALDLHHQASVIRVMHRLHTSGDSTIVWVAHDLNLVGQICSRLVLMAEGKIVAEGTPEEVLRAELLSEVYSTTVEVSVDAAGRRRVELAMDSLMEVSR